MPLGEVIFLRNGRRASGALSSPKKLLMFPQWTSAWEFCVPAGTLDSRQILNCITKCNFNLLNTFFTHLMHYVELSLFLTWWAMILLTFLEEKDPTGPHIRNCEIGTYYMLFLIPCNKGSWEFGKGPIYKFGGGDVTFSFGHVYNQSVMWHRYTGVWHTTCCLTDFLLLIFWTINSFIAKFIFS